jgi:hypothetical protein
MGIFGEEGKQVGSSDHLKCDAEAKLDVPLEITATDIGGVANSCSSLRGVECGELRDFTDGGIAELADEYADQVHRDTGRSSKRFGRAASRML